MIAEAAVAAPPIRCPCGQHLPDVTVLLTHLSTSSECFRLVNEQVYICGHKWHGFICLKCGGDWRRIVMYRQILGEITARRFKERFPS